MSNFQDTFETRKRSFISTFSICMTVPLNCYVEPRILDSLAKLSNILGRTKIISSY